MAARSPLAFQVRADAAGLGRVLGAYTGSVVPQAARYAVNGVVYAARDGLRDEARRVLDRPVDYTVKLACVTSLARLDGQGAVAGRVFVKDRQSAFLAFQIVGGAASGSRATSAPASGPSSCRSRLNSWTPTATCAGTP